ncbi:hypothetical protein F5Y15DRAFT_92357 [Xylariaceae sp. FL0016]|nr:hypothetical protein F5Y15DRAFT_92357 [Xylariaceae sp. FL0016]
MLPGHPAVSVGHRGSSRQSQAVLVRDQQACIPLTRVLTEGDVVVLLTPVTVAFDSSSSNTQDPFEPLGRALAIRHPWIRHVPYTLRNGITSIHVGFIKRAKAVIFVITGPTRYGKPSQLEIASMAQLIGEQQPQIVVACRDAQDLGLMENDFPTVVQLSGYSTAGLQAAAAVLFGETMPSGGSGVSVQELIIAPKFWPPEEWSGPDVTPIQDLWNQCLPEQFRLEKFPLRNLLQRDGYAMHFIVRLPDTREIVGFCATYTTFVDKAGERLIGSLAMIIVKSSYRKRGIGRSLYDHALRQLKRIRGVDRIQLGSTFPRLLSGIPTGSPSEEWFQKREWQMDRQIPGHGQDVCDWLLRIEDWPEGVFSAASAGLLFRPGTFDDRNHMTDFIEKETARKDHTGWYDQYMNLAHDGRLSDMILGIERSEIVAAALIYTPHEGSPLALDLPWAQAIGSDVGGVTCICIAG